MYVIRYMKLLLDSIKINIGCKNEICVQLIKSMYNNKNKRPKLHEFAHIQ